MLGRFVARVRAWKSLTVARQADESGSVDGGVRPRDPRRGRDRDAPDHLGDRQPRDLAVVRLRDRQGAPVVTERRWFPRAGRGGTRRHRAASARARSGDRRVRVPAAPGRAVGAGGDPGRSGRARPARGRARGASGRTGRERRSRSRRVPSAPRTARCPAPTSRSGSGQRSVARSASPSTTRRSPTSRSSGSCSRIPICTRRR